MKEEREEEEGGGKIYVLMRTEGRKKKCVGGEEGKSLYGGASESGERRGFEPLACACPDWLVPGTTGGTAADSARYQYLRCSCARHTTASTATTRAGFPGCVVLASPLRAKFFLRGSFQPTISLRDCL